MLSTVFEQFVQESPISAMVRVLMERIFMPERLDNIVTRYPAGKLRLRLTFMSEGKFKIHSEVADKFKINLITKARA
ncbi:hypothetical protein NIES2101_31195 [Calothrix sp. HK-06]|nr:hypothetical protein NIES2101_31195 [Calothrix sp. HK-06]